MLSPNDNLPKPDILSCIANLSSDEVFTPPIIANQVLDLLPPEVWTNPNLKWLDPAIKSGVFLREIGRRLMIGLETQMADERLRREHILRNMLFGISITELTSLISRRTLYYSKDASTSNSSVRFENHEGNIVFIDQKHEYIGNKCERCGATKPGTIELSDNENATPAVTEEHAYSFIHQESFPKHFPMKFDVIISNPPYQLSDGGFGASSRPLYHLFVERAKQVADYVCMIIPSRWFAGGKGLDEFRAEMLGDKRIKELVDFPNACDCFPDVEIKGGVCYFFWSRSHSGKCRVTTRWGSTTDTMERNLGTHRTFVRFNQALSILEKVEAAKWPSMELQVSSRKPFGLATDVRPENSGDVVLYAQKAKGFISSSKITQNNELINRWKVLVPNAGPGNLDYPHRILSPMLIAEPGSACTETYLIAGVFNSESVANNLRHYLRTRFARFLICLKKNTQHVTKERFEFVPQLDMTRSWDDEALYNLFNINPKERQFIESLIREMA